MTLDTDNYLIEKKVIFSLSDGILQNTTTQDKISLKKTVALCLYFLIKNQNSIKTQNEIMEFAWGNDYRQTSFNTFYQSILILRKAFNTLGLDKPIIVTIPRKGVIIYSDILIEIFTTQIDKTISIKKANNSSLLKWIENTSPLKIKMALISLLTPFLIYLLLNNDTQVQFKKYQLMGKTKNNCSYYFNKSLGGYSRHYKFINKYPDICAPKSHVYITANENILNISALICTASLDDFENNSCSSLYLPEFQ